jgi:hypothetical protein
MVEGPQPKLFLRPEELLVAVWVCSRRNQVNILTECGDHRLHVRHWFQSTGEASRADASSGERCSILSRRCRTIVINTACRTVSDNAVCVAKVHIPIIHPRMKPQVIAAINAYPRSRPIVTLWLPHKTGQSLGVMNP